MTSAHGEESAARYAADANVLLSAACGKAALRVFRVENPPSILTPDAVLAEVGEYLEELAARAGLPLLVVRTHLESFPIEIVPEARYSIKMKTAMALIGSRDPDDAHLLALALALEIPIWSNDNDFRDCGVPVFTTARLLKHLGA